MLPHPSLLVALCLRFRCAWSLPWRWIRLISRCPILPKTLLTARKLLSVFVLSMRLSVSSQKCANAPAIEGRKPLRTHPANDQDNWLSMTITWLKPDACFSWCKMPHILIWFSHIPSFYSMPASRKWVWIILGPTRNMESALASTQAPLKLRSLVHASCSRVC